MDCSRCAEPAVAWIRYSGEHLCRGDFLAFVERRMKRELRGQADLAGGARIAIGMSGGKDSSVAAVLVHDALSGRPDVEFVGITVDEGIASYRPQGIEVARGLCASLGIEHRVISYASTAGHAMDEIVGLEPAAIPCSYCGPFRREALNRAARDADADFVVTGLNLDDTAQSILMNLARADLERLARLGPHDRVQPGLVPRLQPLRTVPEAEVYLYAMLRRIPFSDASCPYAERAQRGRFRDLVSRLEKDTPGTRHAILSSYEQLRPLLQERFPPAELRACEGCGEPTVNALCKACELRGRLARLALPDVEGSL